MPIQVTGSTERPSPQTRIAQMLENAEEQVKLRIPVLIYDRSTTNYTAIPEAAWTLSLDKEEATVERVEEIIEAVKAALLAIGELGPTVVVARLELPEIS